MGGKRKSSSPQQAARQIRFTMQMPSTPSSDSSCTPEKRQKKSDGLALREPGSHMELDAALDGGAKVNAADFMAQHVARPLFPTSAQSKLSSADLLEQQKAADAEQLQKNLDEQKHHKLPSADPLEQQDSEQPQKNLDEQKHRKLPSADPLEQQEATDSQQPQKKLDEQKHCKLPSADPLEQQEATDSEQPQKKLHEQIQQILWSSNKQILSRLRLSLMRRSNTSCLQQIWSSWKELFLSSLRRNLMRRSITSCLQQILLSSWKQHSLSRCRRNRPCLLTSRLPWSSCALSFLCQST